MRIVRRLRQAVVIAALVLSMAACSTFPNEAFANGAPPSRIAVVVRGIGFDSVPVEFGAECEANKCKIRSQWGGIAYSVVYDGEIEHNNQPCLVDGRGRRRRHVWVDDVKQTKGEIEFRYSTGVGCEKFDIVERLEIVGPVVEEEAKYILASLPGAWRVCALNNVVNLKCESRREVYDRVRNLSRDAAMYEWLAGNS